MVLRIWTLLLAAMLFVAPAAAMEVEVPAEAEVCGDDFAVQIVTDLPAATPARVVIGRIGESMPPSPARSRVFRPPRPPAD